MRGNSPGTFEARGAKGVDEPVRNLNDGDNLIRRTRCVVSSPVASGVRLLLLPLPLLLMLLQAFGLSAILAYDSSKGLVSRRARTKLYCCVNTNFCADTLRFPLFVSLCLCDSRLYCSSLTDPRTNEPRWPASIVRSRRTSKNGA